VNAVGCSVHFLVHRFTADVLATAAAIGELVVGVRLR
jgi:hypothetical protein